MKKCKNNRNIRNLSRMIINYLQKTTRRTFRFNEQHMFWTGQLLSIEWLHCMENVAAKVGNTQVLYMYMYMYILAVMSVVIIRWRERFQY